MSGRSLLLFALAVGVSFIPACGEGPPKPPGAVPTVPVKGQIHVDGKPLHGIQVWLAPAEAGDNKQATPAQVPSNHTGGTDKDGNFFISTYFTNDGAPAGDYVLVLYYIPPTEERTSMDEDDGVPVKDPTARALNQKYGYPAKSDIKVTLEAGKPKDMGLIELTTK
jgi:hypothetical protein